MNKFLLTILFFSFLLFNSCSYKPESVSRIRIKGSDTMLLLTNYLAEEYMKQNPYVSIYVEGGGTASGIKALSKGEVEISTASRSLMGEEIKIIADKFGSLGMSFLIAKDALSIYVNEKNKVRDFTLQQLKDIYTCKITNWKELGGADKPIVPFVRTPNSGTYLYFKDHILLGEEYCSSVQVEITTENIIEQVESNVNAIGYGGIGFKGDFVSAKINGIEASEENVRNDKYPISRYLHFYTLNLPTGEVKKFIDWILSPEGQKIIKQVGYVPLWERPF